MKQPDLKSVSGEVVAKVLGIPRRTHTSLVRKEVLPKSGRDRKYDLPATVAAFITYKVNASTPSTIADEKCRVLKETADRLALANGRETGRLVYVEHVAEVYNRLCAFLVRHLEALPNRAVPNLAGISDPGQQRDVLLRHVRDVRKFTADYLTNFPDLPEGINANQKKALQVLIGAAEAEDDHETE